jgi:tetratricopeptide (TPR) repeat protein
MINFKAKMPCMLVIIYFFFTSHVNASSAAPWVGTSLNGNLCSGKGQGYGPYDYTKRGSLAEYLYLVEKAHFQPHVEMLSSKKSNREEMYADLDYTLRAFPNHHRALNTLNRFIDSKVDYRATKLSSPECYFLRALHFSPKDSITHMLYGAFLQKLKEHELALKSYKIAESLNPSSAQLQYNLGLLYIDMENYKEAKTYASKAYAQNFPYKGLKNKLKKMGVW